MNKNRIKNKNKISMNKKKIKKIKYQIQKSKNYVKKRIKEINLSIKTSFLSKLLVQKNKNKIKITRQEKKGNNN